MVVRNGRDHLVLQQYVLPVVFLLAAHTAVCGTYLVYGPSSSAVRRFYDANMVLSARRFRRRRWTIVTHFFAHLDALHFVVNMLSNYSFGGVACQMLGMPVCNPLYPCRDRHAAPSVREKVAHPTMVEPRECRHAESGSTAADRDVLPQAAHGARPRHPCSVGGHERCKVSEGIQTRKGWARM